ncbi:MAG: hypothetical protein ABIT35_09085 [Chitinophagaceae bacterium]
MGKNKFSFAISSGAYDDANNIALWYNDKIDGLGYRFLSKLKKSFDKIHFSPSSFSQLGFKSNIRKYTVAGFPYKIYFLFREEHIEILAIVHMSRSNKFIKRKLK